MSVDTAHTLRISRVVQADRRAVWDAWTKPEHMKKWSCPAPGGAQEVVSDFRVGGSFTLSMVVDGNAHTAFGTYREIDEPRRLVYTWDWREEDHRVGETLVTVEFAELDGATEITLVHEGFAHVEQRDGHEEGWGACMAHFAALFA
jgi:uncharacterized protein YndB with AHSA1/START domain